MKCNCPSSAHGHRPGKCVSEATNETYCPRCHAHKAKEDAAKLHGKSTDITKPRSGGRINTSSVSLGEGE